MICPTIGKRATGADSKLFVPSPGRSDPGRAWRSPGWCSQARRVPESETMKSVIAHRCSGVSESANDGIGVPLSPVLIVRKISSRDEPPRKVQLCARSAGAYRMVPVVHQRWRRWSVAAAERTVALARSRCPRRASCRARSTPSWCSARSAAHGLGDVFRVREIGRERRDEVGEIRHFLVGEVGQAGIEVYGMPRLMMLTRS